MAELRRLFDWHGSPYHDAEETDPARKFNRWQMHNVPVIRELHHSLELIRHVSELYRRPMKPSYAFLSMYGPDGVCPRHTDREQCYATIDLMVRGDKENPWPIFIKGTDGTESEFLLEPGESVIYSGQHQEHWRNPMQPLHGDSADLVFFHFVPTNYHGRMD